MPTTKEIQENLEFKKVRNGLFSYQLKNNANNDSGKNILVLFNAQNKPANYKLNQSWNLAVLGDSFNFEGKETVSGSFNVPAISMVVLFEE